MAEMIKQGLNLSQVSPVMQLVAVFKPSIAYIGPVIHVGDHDIFYSAVNLVLSLLHCLAAAANN